MNLFVLFMSLVLLCSHQRPVSSFIAPSAAPQLISSSQYYGHNTSPTPVTPIYARSLSSPDWTPDTKETSSELLRMLQSKASTNSKNDARLDDQINSLVQTLIASKSHFDPAKSIDGPLFASIHFTGSDTPLWEKIGSAGGVRNVKGQKYTLDGGTSGTFVNYAEILGQNFYLKAMGDCKDEGPVSSLPLGVTSKEKSSSNNLLEALALFKSGNGDDNQQSALLPTPYDYSATVTGASIVLFQKFSLDLSIEGTGTVRVLYADENLRIFLSPTDTNVTKGGGDWESEGLVVVQVRVDLVYDDWAGPF